MPLYTLRAASYSPLAGVITLPRRFGDNLLSASSSIRFFDWFAGAGHELNQLYITIWLVLTSFGALHRFGAPQHSPAGFLGVLGWDPVRSAYPCESVHRPEDDT